MNFLAGVVLGLREIWGNKFRSLLTLSGIIFGVPALQPPAPQAARPLTL